MKIAQVYALTQPLFCPHCSQHPNAYGVELSAACFTQQITEEKDLVICGQCTDTFYTKFTLDSKVEVHYTPSPL